MIDPGLRMRVLLAAAAMGTVGSVIACLSPSDQSFSAPAAAASDDPAVADAAAPDGVSTPARDGGPTTRPDVVVGTAHGGFALFGTTLAQWGYGASPSGAVAHRALDVALGSLDGSEALLCSRVEGADVACATDEQGPNVGTLAFTSVPGTAAAKELSVGGQHACIINANRTVSCWGRGTNGQLGNGSSFQADPHALVTTGKPGDLDHVVCGPRATCAIRTGTGAVVCWGDRFGDTPALLWNGRRPDQLVMGGAEGTSFACGRFGSDVQCAGDAGAGTVFTTAAGTTSGADDVVLAGVTTIAAGNHEVCGKRIDGGLSCFGSHPVVGEQASSIARAYTVLGLPSGAALLARLGDGHACANSAGAIHCWGVNELGQLGQGDTVARPLDRAVLVRF